MNRRIGYYLAAAALALAAIAGALQGGAAIAGAKMDEIRFEQNSWVGHPQGTEVSVAGASTQPGVVLAGFKTRAGGTEIAV
jgi:hypothetical protein